MVSIAQTLHTRGNITKLLVATGQITCAIAQEASVMVITKISDFGGIGIGKDVFRRDGAVACRGPRAAVLGEPPKRAAPRQLPDVHRDPPRLVAGEDRLPKSAARSYQDRWPNGHHGLITDALARRCLKCLVGDFMEDIFVRFVEFSGDVDAVIHGDHPYSIVNGAIAPAA